MSVLSEKVRTALYTALNVAAVVGAGKASAVYSQRPDEGAVFPYVIFSRLAQGRIPYTFGYNAVLEDDIWLVKAVSDETVSYPMDKNETILALCMTAIGNSLTLSGGTTLAVYVLNDIPPYTEDTLDGTVYHNGFQLRVVTSAIEDDTVVTYLGETVTYLGETVTYAG